MSDSRFVRLRPDPVAAAYPKERDRGWRLRLERNPDRGYSSDAFLAQERVLPEQVNNPDARRVTSISEVQLTREDLAWFVAEGAALLAAWPENT